jgi:hypothetical protein
VYCFSRKMVRRVILLEKRYVRCKYDMYNTITVLQTHGQCFGTELASIRKVL